MVKTVGTKPLLSEAATRLLGALAHHADVFEIGAGASTVYLAERARRVLSVEHDPEWHEAVSRALDDRGLDNAEVRLVEMGQLAEEIWQHRTFWDVVFVDCQHQWRGFAVANAAKHVKMCGWIVADDYDFANVRTAVEQLRGAGWGVAIVKGTKVHTDKKKPVKALTAFCQKPVGR